MADIGFAFNPTICSDRVLLVEIISDDDLDSKSDYEACDCVPIRKRKRDQLDKEIGDEAAHSDYSECFPIVKVQTLHISSPILSEKSPFFYKLFKNSARESQQSTLRISASEEAPFMDLLNFIHNNTLNATSVPDLLNVLAASGKFEVTSCMQYCSHLLQKLPMSLESALLYIELPSCVLMAEAVQQLTLAAKQPLAPLYKLQEEAMSLTLSELEFVIRSDDVQVKFEDEVLDFILKWARAHYPKQEECREILTKRLARLIRFPYMTYWKLKEVLVCPDFDHEVVSKLVREALFFKSGLAYGECTHVAKDPATTIINRRFIERVYEYRHIRVVHLQLPHWPRCVVYFDLKKDDCANLLTSKRIYSLPFHLGGRCFYLKVECRKDQDTSFYHLGLFVYMCRNNKTCTLDFEFEVKKKPSEEFQRKYMVDNCTFSGGQCDGQKNLFGIPWTDFVSDGNDYFINGILHLRAELTLKNSPKS